MGKTDLQLRNKAIPFQGQIHQLNSSALSSQRISMATPGDLVQLAALGTTNTIRYFPVRFIRPHASNIIQAYFTARLKLAVGNAAKVWIGPVIFQDEINAKALDASVETQIKQWHERVFGSAAGISVAAGGTLAVDAANITRLITNDPASPLYSRHFFGVTLLFEAAPVMTGTYDVQKFKIDASANFGGL